MNEKEKDIRLLLDRFMAGETSLEEEALIGEWFVWIFRRGHAS